MATSQIATNMGAVHAHNVFARNNDNMSAALNRVSTGLKISSAKDNASQYAISERMLERINANQQASQNVQTDQAMTNTASGAISNIVDIIKQLRSRAIDAANDSNNDSDRQTIQNDIANLIKQIDYTADNTKFNGKSLLDGSTSKEMVVCATSATALLAVTTGSTMTDLFAGESATDTYRLVVSWGNATGTVKIDNTTSVTDMKGTNSLKDVFDKVGTILGNGFAVSTIAANGTLTTKDQNGRTLSATAAGIEVVSKTAGSTGNFSGLRVQIISNYSGNKKEYSFDTLAVEGKSSNTTLSNLTFQVGDLTGMSTNLVIGDMHASALGISGIDVSGSREVAEATINVIDTALNKALKEQTNVGAMEQRLGFTADNLDTMNENLQASASAVRDADMSAEISNFMKMSVLSQASQYMLAQANQNAFQVLNLLQ